jgi:hypothetical protein
MCETSVADPFSFLNGSFFILLVQNELVFVLEIVLEPLGDFGHARK